MYMYIRVCRVRGGGGNPGKWWVENEIVLPCIKFPTFVPFLFVRVGRVGKLEGKGGGWLDNQIFPLVSNFPLLYQFVYKGRESGGMGRGPLGNQIILLCIKFPTFVPFYSACT